MGIKKRIWGYSAIIVPAVVIAIGLGVRFSFLSTDRVAPGAKVGTVDVGGLSRADAMSKIRQDAKLRLSQSFTFTANGKKWAGTLRDVGVVADTKSMLNEAYSIGRKGNLLSRVAVTLFSPKNIRPEYKCDRAKLEDLISKMRAATTVPARDAKISFSGGFRSIAPELPGTTIDSGSSIRLIESAVESSESSVTLPIVTDRPEVTAADLQSVDTLLASYTTHYPGWRKERTHNIRTAVSKVDGKLIKPGGIFSYNEAVGPRQKENGFQDALIYVEGKIITGTGGGICQLSSTLYNTALLANLRIVERSHHSMPVPYVPLGRDATVAYGLLDLKLKNITSTPIYVTAKMGGGTLTVSMYGAGRDKRDIRIVTSEPKQVTSSSGKVRTAVKVYRILRENGVEISKTRISSDKYNQAPPHENSRPAKPVRIALQRIGQKPIDR